MRCQLCGEIIKNKDYHYNIELHEYVYDGYRKESTDLIERLINFQINNKKMRKSFEDDNLDYDDYIKNYIEIQYKELEKEDIPFSEIINIINICTNCMPEEIKKSIEDHKDTDFCNYCNKKFKNYDKMIIPIKLGKEIKDLTNSTCYCFNCFPSEKIKKILLKRA